MDDLLVESFVGDIEAAFQWILQSLQHVLNVLCSHDFLGQNFWWLSMIMTTINIENDNGNNENNDIDNDSSGGVKPMLSAKWP